MKEAETNRRISRRELLKSIGRGGLIVGGTALGVVSSIDLYTALKEDSERISTPILENIPRKGRDWIGVMIGVGLTGVGGVMVQGAREKRLREAYHRK